MKWFVITFSLVCIGLSLLPANNAEVWEDEEHEVLVRNTRGVHNREACRYGKGPWSECDFKTNKKSRTLTLRKGDQTCEQKKTIQKDCKRGCRYDKGVWSNCKENGEMTRTDKLKVNSDESCERERKVTKKCNNNKATKNNKAKGNKANRGNRQKEATA